jgi:hypothetical protein
VNVLPGVLHNCPTTRTPESVREADLISGPFCSSLGPASVSGRIGTGLAFGSPLSFGVGPSPPRSIPSPTLEWIELRRIVVPVPR